MTPVALHVCAEIRVHLKDVGVLVEKGLECFDCVEKRIKFAVEANISLCKAFLYEGGEEFHF